jgi:hypothetical protein
MGPPSYMWSVVDRNVVIRRISVYWDMLNRVVTPKYDTGQDNTLVGNFHLFYVLKSSGNIAHNLKAQKRRRTWQRYYRPSWDQMNERLKVRRCLKRKILQHWPMQVSVILFTGSRNRDSDSLRAGLSGIESRWRRDFPHPSKPAVGSTQPPIQRVPGLSWG